MLGDHSESRRVGRVIVPGLFARAAKRLLQPRTAAEQPVELAANPALARRDRVTRPATFALAPLSQGAAAPRRFGETAPRG
jgi:hypothetical protein